jgi:hypothetical protein
MVRATWFGGEPGLIPCRRLERLIEPAELERAQRDLDQARQQIKEYRHLLKIECMFCGGGIHHCLAFLGAAPCSADPEGGSLE